MDDNSGRSQLLDAVIEHFTTEGLGDQSLRRIAAAVGSSHRMLIYHFGSKDGLLLEVARTVEARTLAQLELVASQEEASSDEVVRAMWAHVTDPALFDFERLFFALYGRALQGETHLRPLLAENIETWLEANVALAATRGVAPATARVHARLGMAVVRGLLLDLLATGDRAGADAALEAFAAHYRTEWWVLQPDVVAAPTIDRAS
jgi:AcrR family transcriptional regulator